MRSICFSLPALLLAALVAGGPAAGAGRGTVLADFESGQAELISYSEDQDQQPDAWELTSSNTYGGSAWALRLFGNTWKAQPITPYPITRETVLQVAAYVESVGEMQAFGVSDGTNTLFYTFYGSQLPAGDEWEVAWQGAFPKEIWNLYLLPVGRDFELRFGYAPTLTQLVYVNDRDGTPHGEIVFDEIIDVTEDLPVAPRAEIVRGRDVVTRLDERLFRVGVQFHAQVYDPDSDSLGYHWDFGDSTTSSEPDPFHEFLVRSNYTYTVHLGVRDETGLWGRDSAQVRVDPGEPQWPLTMNFVGDVMLARGYDVPGGLIDTYGPEYVFAPTRPMYGEAAEVNVCNLECPLTDEGTPHPTKSYVFRGRPSNVRGLTYAGIDLVSLANNHIIDYGRRGMEETQQVLDSVAIRWSGAGDDEYLALQPSFWTEQGVAVGFVNECNRTGREYNYQPFLDAAYNKPGFAYLTQPNLTGSIDAVRPLVDLVVAQLHAGIEYTTGPGTNLGTGLPLREPPFDAAGPVPGMPEVVFPTRPDPSDRQLRWIAVDQGADLVICHHPHVLQGFEVYHGVLIAHSLGNFAFDQSFAETMPSVVLKSEFDKDGFHAFTFRPVFIDDLVPHPASGRLGREILDRMADYSRELNTVVSVDPANQEGRIYLDPEGVAWDPSMDTRNVTLSESEGWWVSPPIERTGAGVLSRVVSVEGTAGAVEVRVGRELLWHGDFEDEGATFWNLNSSSETYDETLYHQGRRSLRQTRDPSHQGPVTTDLEGYPPTLGGRDFSICGWIRTSNAKDAGFAARLFRGRGGEPVGTFESGALLSGDHDWLWQASDFTLPDDAAYFNVRAHLDRPDSGEAFAWYDELRLVEWEPWQSGSLPLSTPHPNNLRFLQVRCSEPATAASVVWEDLRVRDLSAVIPEAPADAHEGAAQFLSRPRPNPFKSRVTIEYRVTRPGRVRLDVFDVAGRRVTTLADGPRSPGSYRTSWDASRFETGLYFCRLEAGGVVGTEKLVVLK